ncbi:MAG: hypothetical protein WA964_10470 [Ilumatobacter sp.]|uniref:hypothetical protein n=1 Tax=Ilumatobacter sp. TaxID=1967498 RepID=UPI003C74AA76
MYPTSQATSSKPHVLCSRPGEPGTCAAAIAEGTGRCCVANTGEVDVTVDLTAVAFIDSARTRIVEQLHGIAPQHFVVVASNRIVRRAFDTSNVTFDDGLHAATPRPVPMLDSVSDVAR